MEKNKIQEKLDEIEKDNYKNKINSYFDNMIDQLNKTRIKFIDIYNENFVKSNSYIKEINDVMNDIKENKINREVILEKLVAISKFEILDKNKFDYLIKKLKNDVDESISYLYSSKILIK